MKLLEDYIALPLATWCAVLVIVVVVVAATDATASTRGLTFRWWGC